MRLTTRNRREKYHNIIEQVDAARTPSEHAWSNVLSTMAMAAALVAAHAILDGLQACISLGVVEPLTISLVISSPARAPAFQIASIYSPSALSAAELAVSPAHLRTLPGRTAVFRIARQPVKRGAVNMQRFPRIPAH